MKIKNVLLAVSVILLYILIFGLIFYLFLRPDEEASPHEHDYGEWAVVEQATCTADGLERRECYCGQSEERIISALGHDYVDGACSVCGDVELVGTEGLEYTLSGDGSYYILSGQGTAEGDIVVSSSIDGVPVKQIADGAFAGTSPEDMSSSGVTVAPLSPNTSITSVVIPGSVEYIGDRAFYMCTALSSITLGNGVKHIGDEAFAGYVQSSALSSTIIVSACSREVAPARYVTSNNALTELVIPDSVEYIGYRAFYFCSALTSVTIGEGVTSIGDEAFALCGIVNITMPDDVMLGTDVFLGCPAFEQ